MPSFAAFRNSVAGKVLIASVLVAAAVGVTWWAVRYYNERVFYFEMAKYRKVSQQGDTVTYRKGSGGEPVVVQSFADRKEVWLRGERYIVRADAGGQEFQVAYPDGTTKTVGRIGKRMLMAKDKNGDWAPEIVVHSGGERIVEPGGTYYTGAEIVRIADETFHERQGNPVLFVLAILLFVYGWCVFRYEAFVRALFRVSYRLWVEDPEPTDFYLFMAKVGGIVGMGFAVFLFFKSL
jgi:hypothetical protein